MKIGLINEKYKTFCPKINSYKTLKKVFKFFNYQFYSNKPSKLYSYLLFFTVSLLKNSPVCQ